jgi:Xaa-Pro dipeptidase
MQSLRIQPEEIRSRLAALREHMRQEGYDGVVLFDDDNIQYLSNFYSIPTQRPVALVVTAERSTLVIPEMDELNLDDSMIVDDVRTYYEYPQDEPLTRIGSACDDLGIADGHIGCDMDGPPRELGYRGPSLSAVVPGTVASVVGYLEQARRTKSDHELALYSEGGTWAALAHRRLQEQVAVGEYPISCAQRAQTAAIESFLDAVGTRYEMTSWEPPVSVVLTAGPDNAYCHNMDQRRRIQRGDLLESFVLVSVDNYKTGKLERTMVVGEPTADHREYFSVVREAQRRLIDAIEPGVTYAEAEATVDEYLAERGLADAQQHRPGHGMGLSWLSLPLLDRGLDGTFSVGEVFTVEPGIYLEDTGGFRHCDVATVTPDGCELLTHYPRDIESLTIPVR